MLIKRARGHRLYSVDGKKILDISMDGGRAVLGHRPNGLSLSIKNAIERGLYAGYDNIYESRLRKEIEKRFPGFTLTILEYEDKVREHFKCDIADPLLEDCTGSKLAYWRPFLKTPDVDNLVVLYPLPGLNTVTLLLTKEEWREKEYSASPVVLSGILRSLYDYDLVLKDFKQEEYSRYLDIPGVEIKAPYIVFKMDDDKYGELVEKALEYGIMLNKRNKIGVLSSEFSMGEASKIITLLRG